MISTEAGMDTVLEEDLDIIVAADLPYETFRDASILITGATGFIGSLLIRAFARVNRAYSLNMQIMGLVRDPGKAERLFGTLAEREDLAFIKGDLLSRDGISSAAIGKVDYVVHAASVTASRQMVAEPVQTILTSFEGTRAMLDLAREKEVKAFLYISSMEMYGSVRQNPENVKENNIGYLDPLAVRSDYPESKRMCENLCIAYCRQYHVPVRIARLAQTFGAGVLPGENRVFAQLARSAINRQDIILHTDGLSEGNYCYTRDAVLAVLTLLLKGEDGEAYNVSNPASHTTIRNMAEMVAHDIAGEKVKVVYDIPAENLYGYAATVKLKLNSDKLQALGWKPEVGLREAYERMIRSMKADKGEKQ